MTIPINAKPKTHTKQMKLTQPDLPSPKCNSAKSADAMQNPAMAEGRPAFSIGRERRGSSFIWISVLASPSRSSPGSRRSSPCWDRSLDDVLNEIPCHAGGGIDRIDRRHVAERVGCRDELRLAPQEY